MVALEDHFDGIVLCLHVFEFGGSSCIEFNIPILIWSSSASLSSLLWINIRIVNISYPPNVLSL